MTSALPQWHLDPVVLCLASSDPDAGQPARDPRIGPAVRRPTYVFIVSILAMIAVGAWRYVSGTLQPVPAGDARAAAGHVDAAAVHAADGVLQRVHRAHRSRGRVERCAGISPARKQERRADARGHGGDVDHDVHRHHAARACVCHRAAAMPKRWCRRLRAPPLAGAAGPTTSCKPRRWPSSCWRRTRHMPTSRDCPRSWRAIDSCRANS